MKKPDLQVTVGRTVFANPVLAASGTASFGEELLEFGASALGGLVLKTVTLEPRQGNLPPRIAETPAGMLNAIGLENPGLDEVIDRCLPGLAGAGPALVVSVHADDPDTLAAMVTRLAAQPNVAAVEVNLSCPNVLGGTAASDDPELTGRFITAAAAGDRKPVWAKVSPESPRLLDTVAAAADAGADAVVVANTYRGAAVDWRARAPLLSRGTGGLSGPAVKPLALVRVALVSRATRLPVVASGGAFSADDVLDLMAVGASAVEIGTAVFVDPAGVCRVPEQLAALLSEQGVESVTDITGTVNVFPDSPGG